MGEVVLLYQVVMFVNSEKTYLNSDTVMIELLQYFGKIT